MTAGRNVRILIVDDHEMIRQGLQFLIASEQDMEVCGEAEDEQQALTLFQTSKPDLVILDISLKSGSGIDVLKRLHAHDAAVPIVIQTMHDERVYGERVFRAGAVAYVNKNDPAHSLITAIRTVLAGRLYYSPAMAGYAMQRFVQGQTGINSFMLERLTDRELEVFQLLGQGLATNQIAEKLHVTRSTIDSYRQRLKTKLAIKSGHELVRYATHWTLDSR